MKLHLNLAEISSSLDTERPISHHSVTNRAVLKKGVDPTVIQSCLDSLDVFRDLLQGIPHQKNRVVRDVCKNIEVKRYQKGNIIYDIGQKSQAVYFCISGTVSICIVKQVQKQVIKQVGNQSGTQFSQNNSPRKQALNTPKGNQNLLTLSSLNQSSISMQENLSVQKFEEEIDSIDAGQGFGQAQFIAQSKRTVKAIAKQQNTLIGKLELQHFAQVLENYKQRVYYKKRDMFQRCALFAKLSMERLQFIINNTKPMTINISHKLTKQGAPVDLIYLVNKGQISLWKTGISHQSQSEEESQNQLKKNKTQNFSPKKLSKSSKVSQQNIILQQQSKIDIEGEQQQQQKKLKIMKGQHILKTNKVYSSIMRIKKQKCPLPKLQNNRVLMGLLSQGCFIGDMQLAMGTCSKFNAICKTQKAQVYYCDRRIILSQMTSQNINEACKYYKQKQKYINEKIKRYKTAKIKIQRQKQIDLLPALTKDQIKLKRKIMHRYVQDRNSLIGHSSPSDIQKMIKIKQKRVVRQPEVSAFPVLQLFPNLSVKKRSQSPTLSPRSFNPLSIVQAPGRKCITQFEQYNKDSSRQKNPQLQRSEQQYKFKSVMIQIKPSRLNLRDLKHGKQKNMAIVGQILGRYKKCQNKLQSIHTIIQKIQNGRA